MPDNNEKNGSFRGQVMVVLILVVVILFPLGYSVVGRAVSRQTGPGDVFLERPDAKYKDCVRETSYMRFHHWELLRGVREDVVRYGIRGDIGLDKCQECHTSRAHFCDKCHDAVSMTPDCWGCHYYP